MPKITYIDSADNARTIDAEVGSTVMETAIKNDVPGIEAECGGACACATCHVYVDEAWREKVGGPSPMEEDMLDFGYDVRPNSRLSCQIKVSDELDGLSCARRAAGVVLAHSGAREPRAGSRRQHDFALGPGIAALRAVARPGRATHAPESSTCSAARSPRPAAAWPCAS